MSHDYAIETDNSRVQLPTFMPEHYIYHQPGVYEQAFGAGVAATRQMAFDGGGRSSPFSPGGLRADLETGMPSLFAEAPSPVTSAPLGLMEQKHSIVIENLRRAAQVKSESSVEKPTGDLAKKLLPWGSTILGTLLVFGLVMMLQKK